MRTSRSACWSWSESDFQKRISVAVFRKDSSMSHLLHDGAPEATTSDTVMGPVMKPPDSPVPGPNRCQKCNFTTYWDFAFKHHLRDTHKSPESGNFDCSSQMPTFKCNEDYYEISCHLASKKHRRDWEEIVDLSSDEDDIPLSKLKQKLRYKCKKCEGFWTFSKLVLLKHLEVCSQELRALKSYQCDNCPFSCKSRRNIRLHKYNMHAPPEVIVWHRCPQCMFRTKHKSNLKQHILSLHTELDDVQWFECEQCTYKSRINAHLKRHSYINHASPDEIQWFECANCPYKATRKYLLILHLRNKHTKIEEIFWWKCEHCEYRAKQKINLDRHVMSKHAKPEDLEWFMCAHCPYKTFKKELLTLHLRNKHTESDLIFWHKCENCDYKAKRRAHLKLHVINKHTDLKDIRWFECDYCPFRAKQRSNLKQHTERVHGMRFIA